MKCMIIDDFKNYKDIEKITIEKMKIVDSIVRRHNKRRRYILEDEGG